MTDVYGYSSSPPPQLDAYSSGILFENSAGGGGPSSPFLAGEDDLDVDASFASSMSISSTDNRPAYRSPQSPYQPLPSQASSHVSMDVSPAYSLGSSIKHPFQAPSRPPPPPPSFASSSSSSSVKTLRRPSPPPPRPSFSRVRAESAEQKRSVPSALGSTRRAFGKEISVNMDSPSRSPAQGPTTVKALGGLMGPPALPGPSNGSPSSSTCGKSAASGMGALKARAPLPSQWKTVKTMGGGSDMRRGGKLFAPVALSRRDSEPAFTDALPVPNIHRPASQEYLPRSSLDMDVDDDENESPFLPSIPASPIASFGAGGYDDFFTGSPSTAPAHKTSFGLGRPQSSSPESSPSSKRSSGGALGSVRSAGGGNLFDRAFSAGPSSGGLFGGPRAATMAARRLGPYKRPALAHFQTSNTMDVIDSPSTSQASAFPIMSANNPSLARGLGPPPLTTASESAAFSGATFPRALPPMRRAYSVSTEAVQDEVDNSSPDCSFEDGSPSQPALKAQQEYAQRHRSRVVRLADGSPAFRPAREGELADGGVKSPSEGSPFHFGGFGSNEKDGKILPCHTSPEDGLMRIDCSTLGNLIGGKYAAEVTRYHIIDCRFDYEFAGGHIDGAVNMRNEADIASYLLSPSQGIYADGSALPLPSTSSSPSPAGGKTVLVFHCEFSKKRGPEMAKKFRTADRAMNQEHYPALHYPEVYILEGGYCEFWKQRPATCNPSAYVPMDDPLHQVKRSTDIHEFRTQTRKFGRAQSWQGEMPAHQQQANSLFSNATVRPHSAALPSLAFAAGAAAQGKRRGAERHVIEEEDHSDLSFSSADGGGLGSPCAAPRANCLAVPVGQVRRLKARVALDRTKSSPLVLGGSLFAGRQ